MQYLVKRKYIYVSYQQNQFFNEYVYSKRAKIVLQPQTTCDDRITREEFEELFNYGDDESDFEGF